MPIIQPLRRVPSTEGDDVGMPPAIGNLPRVTVAEQVAHLKARLKHYGVKNIFNESTIAGLIAKKDIHNDIIDRAQARIDATPRVAQRPRDGFVVGEYKYSNWMPYPHIEFHPPVPYRHAVKARSVDKRMAFAICNETVDGIAIGLLPYHPIIVSCTSIAPLEKYADEVGNIDIRKVLQEGRSRPMMALDN